MMRNRIFSKLILTVIVLTMILQTSSCTKKPKESSITPQDKLLKGTCTWDIDSNVDGVRDSVDLWWEHVNENERYLVPQNGAQIAILKNKTFESVALSDLQTTEFMTSKISASDSNPVLNEGSVLAVRTNEGRYAKIEVTGFEPLNNSRYDNKKYHMKLRYVIYQ